MVVTELQGILLGWISDTDVCEWPDGQWRLYRPSRDVRNPVTSDIELLIKLGAITVAVVRGVKTAQITKIGREQLAEFEALRERRYQESKRKLAEIEGRL